MREFSVYQWDPVAGEWLGSHRFGERDAADYARWLKQEGEYAFVACPTVVHPAETAGLLGYVWRGIPHTDPHRDRQKRKRQIMGVM